MSDNLAIVKLHCNQQYLEQCVDLLNDFWPRSRTARRVSPVPFESSLHNRLHSLNKSNDNFPINYIMVSSDGQVIGHCSVSLQSDSGREKTAHIESLIIKKNHRRKGLGRYMMNELEKMLTQEQFKVITLKTIDQLAFYESIGYVLKCKMRSLVVGQIRKRVNKQSNQPLNEKSNEVNQQKDKNLNEIKLISSCDQSICQSDEKNSMRDSLKNFNIKNQDAKPVQSNDSQLNRLPLPPPLPVADQSNHVIEYFMEKIL